MSNPTVPGHGSRRVLAAASTIAPVMSSSPRIPTLPPRFRVSACKVLVSRDVPVGPEPRSFQPHLDAIA